MNRAERRNLSKKIKKANKSFNLGLNKTQLKDYIKFKEEQLSSIVFFEGDKVQIDYDGITSRVDYDKRRPEYRNFIEENKNTIFTVKYDEKYRNNPWLVSLEEDTTEPRWLFTTSDLILYNNEEKESN